jgi:hypothetical protein
MVRDFYDTLWRRFPPIFPNAEQDSKQTQEQGNCPAHAGCGSGCGKTIAGKFRFAI